MRIGPLISALVAAFIALAAATGARADDPPSLELAKRAVEQIRGTAHREKMRIQWAAVEDETPPEGADVLLVRGYISFRLIRMVYRGDRIEAGSALAARTWFYNEAGESFDASEFDVDPARFALAWNAMRRILAASDERIEPEPADHPRGGSISSVSHASVDWIRVLASPDAAPVHCEGRPRSAFAWDDVRLWRGLRDRALFDLFAALLPKTWDEHRPADVATWRGFAAAAVRAAAVGLDGNRVRRDHDFLDACLRVLGECGDEGSEADVAALDVALAGLDQADYWITQLRDEAARTATRLRVRFHWSRDVIEQALRQLSTRTGADRDQAKWLTETYRTKDPDGWLQFLVEEASSPDASMESVAAVAAEARVLPAAQSIRLLRGLLTQDDPAVRVEAALALHELSPDDVAASAVVTAVALDRRIGWDGCSERVGRANRRSRSRAFNAALDWGGLTPTALRAHFVVPEREDVEFLDAVVNRLRDTPEALTDGEVRDAWRRVLDGRSEWTVIAAVRFLIGVRDVESKDRMLEALHRAASSAPSEIGRANVIDELRERVLALRTPGSEEK